MLKKHGTSKNGLSKYFSHHLVRVGELYCRGGDLQQGRLAYRQAIRLYPYAVQYYLHFALSMVGLANWNRVKNLKQKYMGSNNE